MVSPIGSFYWPGDRPGRDAACRSLAARRAITVFCYCSDARGRHLCIRPVEARRHLDGTPMTVALTAATDESPDHGDREARLIVEHMPGFAWSAGQDGKLRYVTPRLVEFTGKRIEDV